MVLKASLQKESPEQSLPKVISEAALRFSKQVLLVNSQNSQENICLLFKRQFNTGAFLRIFRNFYNSFINRTPPVASVDLLYLIKNKMGWFLLKRFVDLARVCYLQISSRNRFDD